MVVLFASGQARSELRDCLKQLCRTKWDDMLVRLPALLQQTNDPELEEEFLNRQQACDYHLSTSLSEGVQHLCV
jgi:hypothetical protein